MPELILALIKIALLVGGLMTAAAYFVLLERWIAAWVQDRRGDWYYGLFAGIFDIRAMGFKPKPLPEAYESFFAAHGIDAKRAAMFDDLEKNLLVPHERGMTTVHVVAPEDWEHDQVDAWELGRGTGPHVHHVTDDLAAFLRDVV